MGPFRRASPLLRPKIAHVCDLTRLGEVQAPVLFTEPQVKRLRVKQLLKRSPTNHIHERLFAASARFAAPCASHAKRQERETAPSAERLSCLLVEQSGGRSMRYELVNVRPDQTPAARRRTQNGPFRLETSCLQGG